MEGIKDLTSFSGVTYNGGLSGGKLLEFFHPVYIGRPNILQMTLACGENIVRVFYYSR